MQNCYYRDKKNHNSEREGNFKGTVLVFSFNPLSANLSQWSNTLNQFISKLPTNCLSVFDHFVKLTLKGLSLRIIFGHNDFNSSINEWNISLNDL